MKGWIGLGNQHDKIERRNGRRGQFSVVLTTVTSTWTMTNLPWQTEGTPGEVGRGQ